MSGQKLKQGYMKKFGKGIVGESWKKVFVELYKDGLFCWYKKKKGSSRKGSVFLPNVCEYLTVGSYCRAIPFSPQLPSGGRLDYMIAFPEEPNKKSKIHFFLNDSEQEFSDWMDAITSTFPSAPPHQQQQQQMQSTQQPMVGAGPYNAFSPAPSAPMAGPPQSTASPFIGFEALSISCSAQPTTGYSAPQQLYTQPAYPPQQPYPQQPYPQQPYPQQPYPQQPYVQQPYPQQPMAPAYPRPPTTAQQPYQQNPYSQQYPQYQTYGGPSSYPVQPGQPYQYPPPQSTVVRNHRSRGSGIGNMATGILGGAVAGYAASRLFGGWGHGFGWGHGSWGSCSWGSGSWGSFSGGSWGSFGSFD